MKHQSRDCKGSVRPSVSHDVVYCPITAWRQWGRPFAEDVSVIHCAFCLSVTTPQLITLLLAFPMVAFLFRERGWLDESNPSGQHSMITSMKMQTAQSEQLNWFTAVMGNLCHLKHYRSNHWKPNRDSTSPPPYEYLSSETSFTSTWVSCT